MVTNVYAKSRYGPLRIRLFRKGNNNSKNNNNRRSDLGPFPGPKILIEGQRVKQATQFNYLGNRDGYREKIYEAELLWKNAFMNKTASDR